MNLFNTVLNLIYDKYNTQITREYAEKTIIKDSDIYKVTTDTEKDEENAEDKKDKKDKEDKEDKKDKKDKKKKKHHHKKELNNKELIDEFIKLYNNFNLEKNGKKIKLDVDKNCICDFLLVDDNEYGISYKAIYEKFADKQNKELENLLDKKINLGIFKDKCKNRINIQQIKEEEIFTFNFGKKKFNFIEVICNSSYRKVIDTQNYEDYNQYELNLYLTEAKMTDLLLKNKKLVNNEIILFNYNDELFSNEINDLISNFKYADRQNLSIDDKVIFYNYISKIPGNDEKYRTIINDFMTLIEYINKNKDNNINKESKISEIEKVKNLQNISKDFQSIFNPDIKKDQKAQENNKKDDLIVNKLPNMLDYFLKIIFKYIKKDIEKYQQKKEEEKNVKDANKESSGIQKEEDKNPNLDKKLIGQLNDIFNEGNMVVKKESLASAIRIFISLVLYREKENDKYRKIKFNRKNIIDYLKARDLWEANIYNSSQFEKNLERIKALNIKIQEILWLYYYLIDNKDEGFENEVKEYKNKKKKSSDSESNSSNSDSESNSSNSDSESSG